VNKFGLNLALTLVVGGAVAEIIATGWRHRAVPSFARAHSLDHRTLSVGPLVYGERAGDPIGQSRLVFEDWQPRLCLWLLRDCGFDLVSLSSIPLQIWRIGKEAQVLETRFGDAYRAYRASTWF
jgi:protein-S-isoprenylcysteine O-methyltransferase Ste14